MAIWLAIEIKNLLIGESALPEAIRDIRKLGGCCPEIEHVNEVLTLIWGPRIFL